ncbi:Envelope fusion protein, partial [Aphis craccivora]
MNEVWNNTSHMQLTDLHSVSKSLDEVQQMIDEEVIREQSQKHQFIHLNLLYATIALAIISIILITAIHILLKCQYISNRQVIDILRRLVQYSSSIRRVGRENYASRIYDEVPLRAPPSP